MNIEPVILESEFVRMKPLRADHIGIVVALDGKPDRRHLGDLKRYVVSAVFDAERGISLPFVTVEKNQTKL